MDVFFLLRGSDFISKNCCDVCMYMKIKNAIYSIHFKEIQDKFSYSYEISENGCSPKKMKTYRNTSIYF